MLDVVTELARAMLSQALYANDLFLMIETIEGLRNKLTKWQEAMKSKGLKVELG